MPYNKDGSRKKGFTMKYNNSSFPFKKDDSDAAKSDAESRKKREEDLKNLNETTYNKSGWFGKVNENLSVKALNKFEEKFKKEHPEKYKLWKKGEIR